MTPAMIDLQTLERLSEDDRSLLAFAAVHGPEFDSAVVARAPGRDAGEVEERLVAMGREHDLIRQERERDFPGGRPVMLVRGWAWLEQGELARGLDEIQRATAAYREAGSAASLPWFLLELAEALGKNGRPTEGLAVLADLPIAQERGVWHRRAEGERHRGQLFLAAGRPAEAEAALRQALALAREDQARWFELLAALALCQMLRDQGRREEARRELAAVYGWFTEGRDTQDLIEARALLSALQQ
jgi:tetratricopeptide (TPR) repeat protein